MRQKMISRSRRLLLEQLEVRRNMASFAPDFFPQGAIDDMEVVKIDSPENQLYPLANDGHVFFGDRWNYPYFLDYLVATPANEDPARLSGSMLTTVPAVDQYEPLQIKILSVTMPKHGTVRIAEDRLSVFYTPDTGFEGVDQFDYVLDGEISEEKSATVSVNVVQPLLAVDDWFLSKPGNTSLNLDVLRNDQFNAFGLNNEAARSQFTIIDVTSPNAGGSVQISEDGKSLNYAAPVGFEGIEKIVYTFEEKDGYRDSAEVSIRVTQSTATSETNWPEFIRQQWLEEILQRSAYQFGRGIGRYDFYPSPLAAVDQNVALSNATTGIRGSESSYSNNQVAGVDESDIVETDGRFLYIFSRSSHVNPYLDLAFRAGTPGAFGQVAPTTEAGELVIIDAIDPKSPKLVSQLSFTGRLLAQHLSGDRLIIVTASYQEGTTTVAIVDISDRTLPGVVRSSVIDGSFSQSRMVGDKFYLFTSAYVQPPTVEPLSTDVNSALFYETGRQFLARLGEDLFDDSLIQVRNFDAAGIPVGEPVDSLTIGDALKIVRGTGVASGIYSFDIDASQDGPFDIDIISMGYAPTIFVASDAIYFFDTRWDSRESIWGSTHIANFNFDPNDGSVELAASGYVDGILLNQFSIGQHHGDLQIFTSVGLAGTQLSILRRDSQDLNVIGSVKNLAPNEQIYSARLAGDRAYVVTFRRVDPLFVLDLSNPTDPKIAGELKLPGYSQYLHLIDSTHLMGIGRDADEQSGMFGSLQVTLFDVSDATNLKLQSSYQFAGGRRTFSPLLEGAFGLSDHHALGHFADVGILALPLTHYPDWFESNIENAKSEDEDLPDVGVLKVDTSTGITSLGGVQSPVPIHRTLRFGEYLYSIASDRIIVTGLLNPEIQHAELLLPEPKVSKDPDSTDHSNESGTNGTTQTNTEVKTLDASTGDSANPIWHNRDNPCDVNGDGAIAPIDVLNVINFLKSHGSGLVADFERPMLARGIAEGLSADKIFQVDVNGDGEIAPLDVLLVINRLQRNSLIRGEGEANADDSAAIVVAVEYDSNAAAIPDFETPARKRQRPSEAES